MTANPEIACFAGERRRFTASRFRNQKAPLCLVTASNRVLMFSAVAGQPCLVNCQVEVAPDQDRTDDQAKQLMAEAIASDEAEVKLRQSYAEKLAKVLPGKKAARYLQIETKIRAIVRYELAATVPLVP
jgi:hypothetical protein